MKFKQSTILGFFDSTQKHFKIPVYQRAYAWEFENWSVFINDLIEQANSENNYFYGNILLETIKMDIEYDVIDGQQRLTTLVIFMRSLIDVLEQKGIMSDDDINSKKEIYLKKSGNIKMRTVGYDKTFFENRIINGDNLVPHRTPSQERILGAKSFFYDELIKLDDAIIIKMLNKIETAEITCIEFENKKDSALMFELQNNRGKDLTNMEKLKSYFMYQLYFTSKPDEVESNIESISDIFSEIYQLINDLPKHLSEDNVLIYHCNAYLMAFNYKNINDIKAKYLISSDKVKWIKEFSANLLKSFINIKKFESEDTHFLKDLKALRIPSFAYPFIIKGYSFFSDSDEKKNTLFHILEVLVFRYKLINTRADIDTRLNEVISNFNGDLSYLCTLIKDKLNNSNYWEDKRVVEQLNGNMYNNDVIKYLLRKYEDEILLNGYTSSIIDKEEEIEHISPKTPTNGEAITSGYEVDENNCYSEEFISNKLHSLGNLMLIAKSHNIIIGNNPFAQKLESYTDKKNPTLCQHAEIGDFIDSKNKKWHSEEIDKRQVKIVDFAKRKWSFDNIKIK